MNSLTYLSRQFDVLASPKTPPSTPSAEDDPYNSLSPLSPDNRPQKRFKTWSASSFLFAPASSSSRIPKRSFSSPSATHLPFEPTTSVSKETAALPQSCAESVISRIFFLRLLVLAWDTFRNAWVAFVETCQLGRRAEIIVTPPQEKSPSIDESSDDESTSTPLTARSPTSQFPIRSNSDPLTLDPPPDTDPTSSRHLQPPQPPIQHCIAVSLTDSAASTPRSSTPVLSTRKTPFLSQKTLVLDLDETLIHSTSRPIPATNSSGFFGFNPFGSRRGSTGHVVEVVLGEKSTLYHVYKRPFVDFFLRTVSGWYTLVIFTASMQEYADPVIDWLDAGRGMLTHRLFRDSCTRLPDGSFTKDLAKIEPDLARVCLIDNSPISYRVNEANGIPIEGWTHDPSDEALLDLLPVLDSLRFTSDVRRVLGLRTAGGGGYS